MIIIKLMGGLGNQMQQYALYKKLETSGYEVRLDTSWFQPDSQKNMLARREMELRFFPCADFTEPTAEELEKVLGKDTIVQKLLKKVMPSQNRKFVESEMFHEEILNLPKDTDLYLEGYWAAEKYYEDILPVLREKFTFPERNEINQQMTEKISQEAYPVSLHLRRGDYLDPVNAEMFGGICTDAYYRGALDHVRNLHPEMKLFVFSDDPAYAAEQYPDAYIVDINHGKESFYDIYLMSLCKANICANSTFSFWGARLNKNKEPVMIRPYKHKNSQEFKPQIMHELWKRYVLLDGIGRIV